MPHSVALRNHVRVMQGTKSTTSRNCQDICYCGATWSAVAAPQSRHCIRFRRWTRQARTTVRPSSPTVCGFRTSDASVGEIEGGPGNFHEGVFGQDARTEELRNDPRRRWSLVEPGEVRDGYGVTRGTWSKLLMTSPFSRAWWSAVVARRSISTASTGDSAKFTTAQYPTRIFTV